jgi:hypothetical protein
MVNFPLFWNKKYMDLVDEHVLVVGVNQVGELITCRTEEIESLEVSNYLTCLQTDDKLVVPARATFGGVYPAATEHVYKTIYSGLIGYGNPCKLEIRFPPGYFLPEVFDAQIKIIETIADITKIEDVSYHIEADTWHSGLLSKGNRKKIRQCKDIGVILKKDDRENIDNVYDLIYQNRLTKGVTPSISQIQLETALRIFPDEYECFSLYLSGELIATAITVMLNSNVRYVYMWADHAEHRTLSPTAMLCEEIVCDARNKGIKVVDLGTASLHGEIDEGLARFKTNLGALATGKHTYVIN